MITDSRTILIILVFLQSVCCWGQNTRQNGYIKTRGTLSDNGSVISGKPLSDVLISLDAGNSVVSDQGGNFSFMTSGLFRITNVRKKGYILIDPDLLNRTHSYSSNPFIIVLDSQESQLSERLLIERKIRRALQLKLEAKEAEIDSLRKLNQITQNEYLSALQECYSEQNENARLVKTMSERYSQIDFDQVSEFGRLISSYIIDGELARADSLINSKGSIAQRIADLHKQRSSNLLIRKELEKSEAFAEHELNDIASDCYHKYEIFQMRHQNDSARYYIEERARLDSTNVGWQLQAGLFLQQIADYSKSRDYFEKSLELAISQYGDNHIMIAHCTNNLGWYYDTIGEYDTAIDYYKKSIEVMSSILGPESKEVGFRYNNLGFVYSNKHMYEMAIDCYQRALSVFRSLSADCEEDIAVSYNKLGLAYYQMGDYETALSCYQSAISAIEGTRFSESQVAINLYNNIGLLQIALGDNEKALSNIEKALDLKIDSYGTMHPDVAIITNNMGNVLYNMGDYSPSLEYYLTSYRILSMYLGVKHPNVALCQSNIGNTYSAIGEYGKALDYHKQALETRLGVLGENDEDTATSYHNIGRIYLVLGQFDLSLDYLSKALEIRTRLYGDDSLETAMSYSSLGALYSELQQYDKSLEYYSHSSSIMKKLLPSNHPKIAEIDSLLSGLQIKVRH